MPLPGPETCPSNSTTQATPSNIPTLSDIGNSILSFGQFVYNTLPAWPKDPMLFQGVEGSIYDDLNNPYWNQGEEKKKIEPVPTTTSVPSVAPKLDVAASSNYLSIDSFDTSLNGIHTWSSMDKGVILNGINAYQRWPTNVAQDDRLKGIALERSNDPIFRVDQLLSAFTPVVSRMIGGQPSVDQYEYAMLKYAVHSKLPPVDKGVAYDSPAHPQPTTPQSALKNDVAQLFFNALGQISEPSGAQVLEVFVRKNTSAALSLDPTLDTLAGFSDRIKASVINRLDLHLPSLKAADRARLNTLAKWFVEASLHAIDPLFNAQFNMRQRDFRDAHYQGRDGALMSIGASFINQFSVKAGTLLTPSILREAGLHSLIDIAPSAWLPSTGSTLTRFGQSIEKRIYGEPSGTATDRMKSGLAALIAPEIPRIRLLQEVNISEERFLRNINDQFNEDGVHKRQSEAALDLLIFSKFKLYSFGLKQLPQIDQDNLVSASRIGQLEVFMPKVVLYDTQHADISYKAALKATSGLIARTGHTESEYYLFSEGRCWGSPVVSKVTEQINRAGGVAQFVNQNHASFTNGIQFQPSNQITFEAPSVYIFSTNIVEIATVVSDLQSFPSAIHKRFTDASPSQPISSTWTEKIFHSDIYAIGKFIVGLVPDGNCVIAVLDMAEMIVAPAKTDAGIATQGLAVATDALFCFTGLIKKNQAQYLMRYVRTPFNYRSSEEFATHKTAQHISEQSPKIEQARGITKKGAESVLSNPLSTRHEDLHFMSDMSEFFDPAPVELTVPPNLISLLGDTLTFPHNLSPSGLIQKFDGGPIYLVMDVSNSGKKVGYLWNEAERQLEKQTDQWLRGYRHLIDDDPQILNSFTQNFPLHSSSARVSDMLYNNKLIKEVRQIKYQSFFDHLPEQLDLGVHSVGDREYIKIEDEFYLVERQLLPTNERCIIGESMPEDLRLDMQYDGATWQISNNHLITPKPTLPSGVTSYQEALQRGFNLPEGWSEPIMYADNTNSEQFIFSFQDKSGRTRYRHGPDRKNAFEVLSNDEFDEKRCRLRRALPDSLQASCSTEGLNIVALPSESERTTAIRRLVALDVETRPYYERSLLRLEIVRDAEKIQSAFPANPQLARHFNALITRMTDNPDLDLSETINKMKSLDWGGNTLTEYQLDGVKIFWDKMKSQLAAESFDDFGGETEALNEVCDTSLQLCENQHTYRQLLKVYGEKK
ncbi:hypothetical protein QN416_01485 [Glaciimonas sp. Cout2]|uniref:hypothetical protein n=1 Tax=Glaciimonas sp. Cout2 TaxID=3048621 RepID=UPI002B230B0C|nr:hypothetical protein [Glaciimonas sp. Cout2]MEB0010283.1 hypothetical protein [Glaciimonas sp. Cout2]